MAAPPPDELRTLAGRVRPSRRAAAGAALAWGVLGGVAATLLVVVYLGFGLLLLAVGGNPAIPAEEVAAATRIVEEMYAGWSAWPVLALGLLGFAAGAMFGQRRAQRHALIAATAEAVATLREADQRS